MPLKIDWHYHRHNCNTCSRALSFLDRNDAQIVEQVDARKNRIPPDEAVKLARSASRLVVAKGKKTVVVDLKRDKPTDAELKSLIVGPSGYLRAPAIRRGRKMFVGFLSDEFAEELLK